VDQPSLRNFGTANTKQVFAFFEYFAVQSPFSVFFPFLHSAFSLCPSFATGLLFLICEE